jgi:hypothetical protein
VTKTTNRSSFKSRVRIMFATSPAHIVLFWMQTCLIWCNSTLVAELTTAPTRKRTPRSPRFSLPLCQHARHSPQTRLSLLAYPPTHPDWSCWLTAPGCASGGSQGPIRRTPCVIRLPSRTFSRLVSLVIDRLNIFITRLGRLCIFVL